MGLFDIFKKKDQVVDSQYQPSTQQQPSHQDYATANSTSSALRLQDFISFNLSAIPVYEWVKYDEYTSNYGARIQKYQKAITDNQKYEMGNFDIVDVIVSNGRPHTLRLYSTFNFISAELICFIQFCIDKLGEDDLGRGGLTGSDIDAAKQGRLSRIWDQVSLRQKEVGGKTIIELTIVLAKLNI